MSALPFDLAGGEAVSARVAASRRPLRILAWSGRVVEAAILPVALGLLWQAASGAGWLPDQILPSPVMVAHSFADLWRSGELRGDIAISLWRVAQGFVIGAVLGLGLGLLMGVSRIGEEMLGPLFKGVSQVPSMAWLPLLMLLLGVGEALKVTAIAKAALIPMAIAVHTGVRAIPAAHLELARALRLPRRTVLARVVLPAVLPAVFQGLRQGLGQAWLSLVGVELLASTAGLGYLMTWGRAIFQLDVVLVGILTVGLIGLVLDAGILAVQRRLLGWSAQR